MTDKETLEYCLNNLKQAGVDKASCSLNLSEKKELNVEIGEMTLFRTTFNSSMGISIIKDQKKGSTSINKTDKESINQAIKQVIDIAEGSKPDPCHDIANKQSPQIFSKGEKTPDLDKMYQSLEEFINYVKHTYPTIQIEQAILDFTKSKSYYMNTNGVDFEIEDGIYGFSPFFLSKDEKNTSSFNYTGFSTLKIDKPLHKYGTIDTLLSQSTEQLHTKSLNDKLVGTIIVTPDCIGDFLGFIINDISDGKMISGNSIYKNKLNTQIANPNFTLYSNPISDEIEDGYYITNDGYVAENSTIIEKGILKTHLLGIYGSNKLDMKRAVNNGGAYIIDPGDIDHQNIIKKIDKGLLLSRFSGGYPAPNGDFSGVAKNSYYIENGEIKYPLTETMISGNIKEMFQNIKYISKDRINFGSSILPWISFDGITIS